MPTVARCFERSIVRSRWLQAMAASRTLVAECEMQGSTATSRSARKASMLSCDDGACRKQLSQRMAV